jgi:O-antigen/teichoic acid export membrane protein
MNVLVKRIYSGLGANVFGQLVSIAIQLLSVPVFLYYWSVTKYGEWLMLSAIPAYFAMADIGVVSVAANKMTMHTARGERAESNGVFKNAFVFTFLLIIFFFILAAALIYLVDFSVLKGGDEKLALLVLVCLALLNIFGGLVEAVFRASGRYAQGTYFLNLARLAEWGLGILFLVLGWGFLGVALGFFAGRLLALVFIWGYAKNKFPNFTWSSQGTRWVEIKSMVVPGVGFMAFPIGNAVSIQGLSLLVGATFGAGALAVFNTYRTLSRVLVQLITAVSRAVWPEISKLYAEKKYASIKRVCLMGSVSIGLLSIFSSVVLYYSAGFILQKWTHGKIEFDAFLFFLFLLATVATAFWQLAMVVTMATNTHTQLSIVFLAASVMVVVLAKVLSASLGIYSNPVALISFEVIMFVASYHAASKTLGNPS